MNKVAVIYWSQTGNTQAMAGAIVEGAKQAGAEASLFQVSDISPQEALKFDVLALGCPAMGAEVLEEAEFEPFFTELEGRIGGQKIGLFGSYGWGDGEWMREWQQRVINSGALLYDGEGLILTDAPDEHGLEKCRAWGNGIATF